MGVDLSNKTIKGLFMQQIQQLTVDKKIQSIDMQFSDNLMGV